MSQKSLTSRTSKKYEQLEYHWSTLVYSMHKSPWHVRTFFVNASTTQILLIMLRLVTNNKNIQDKEKEVHMNFVDDKSTLYYFWIGTWPLPSPHATGIVKVSHCPSLDPTFNAKLTHWYSPYIQLHIYSCTLKYDRFNTSTTLTVFFSLIL